MTIVFAAPRSSRETIRYQGRTFSLRGMGFDRLNESGFEGRPFRRRHECQLVP